MLTLMLLVANSANMKWCKPWHNGTHLRAFMSYPMNTNMTGLEVFQKSVLPCALDESSLSIWRVNWPVVTSPCICSSLILRNLQHSQLFSLQIRDPRCSHSNNAVTLTMTNLSNKLTDLYLGCTTVNIIRVIQWFLKNKLSKNCFVFKIFSCLHSGHESGKENL